MTATEQLVMLYRMLVLSIRLVCAVDPCCFGILFLVFPLCQHSFRPIKCSHQLTAFTRATRCAGCLISDGLYQFCKSSGILHVLTPTFRCSLRFHATVNIYLPIPVPERSKARVCGHSLARIAGSNAAVGMDVSNVL